MRSISPYARFAITLHFVLLSLGTAHASPFGNYGFGAVGTSSAGALTTSATDYHSVFYNPAQLLAKKRVHMGLGTAYIAPHLVIEQNKADSIYQAVVPKQNVGIHLGLSAPVAGPFKRKLALGIGFFIPLIQNSRVEALDPHTPQAYMYQSLPDRIFLGLGAAYELHPTLHLGVGFQVLASLDGSAEASLSVVQQRVTERTLRVDFFGEIAPIAGLSWRPMDSFKVGLAYRGALGFAYNLPIKLEIEEVGVLEFQAKGVSLWDPDVVDFGASWFLDDWDLTISATLSWALWSSAPAPNNIMSVMIDDSFLQGGESVDSDALIWVKTDPIDLGMTDIFIPRISFLWRPNPTWHIRTGYAFRPTPLPHATGAATYLDASTHIMGLGAGWTIGDPTRVQDEPLTIELAAQWQHLQPRSNIKKDAENATGDVRILGDVMVFQLEVHHDF